MATLHCAAPGPAEESLEREFPQILRYARGFPVKDVRVIALIAQRDEAEVHLGERIACLVIPQDGHDQAKLLELLEASTSEFGEQQLWYR